MRVGDIVLYKQAEGELLAPAIVLKEWPDDTLQLYVFRFEGNVLIRAAHPTQIKLSTLDEEDQDVTAALSHRIDNIERMIESGVLNRPVIIESIEQPVKDEEPELVGSTSTGKVKKPWPK